MLNYDLGLLTPAEAAHLRKLNVPPPANWIEQGTQVKTILLTKGSVTLGIVVLPTLAKDMQANPTEELRKAITSAADSLRGKTDLVVALSTWGIQAEQNLLEKPLLDVDLLLGAGQGIGLTGRLMNQDALLWVRVYDKGKALQRIEILTMPARDASGFSWHQGKSISWTTLPLSEKVYSDPSILDIFESLDKNKH